MADYDRDRDDDDRTRREGGGARRHNSESEGYPGERDRHQRRGSEVFGPYARENWTGGERDREIHGEGRIRNERSIRNEPIHNEGYDYRLAGRDWDRFERQTGRGAEGWIGSERRHSEFRDRDRDDIPERRGSFGRELSSDYGAARHGLNPEGLDWGRDLGSGERSRRYDAGGRDPGDREWSDRISRERHSRDSGGRSDWNRGDRDRERGSGYQGEHEVQGGFIVPGPYAGRGPRGYSRSDERIREDVSDQLMEHPEIDASDVEVRVESGEVILEGTVESRVQKYEAENLASRIPGVKDVNNLIRLKRQDTNILGGQRASGTPGNEGSTGTGGQRTPGASDTGTEPGPRTNPR